MTDFWLLLMSVTCPPGGGTVVLRTQTNKSFTTTVGDSVSCSTRHIVCLAVLMC